MKELMASSITPGTCFDTTAGWLWYCDAHDTHGNADWEDEARAVSRAHQKFFGRHAECDLYIWQRGADA